MFISHMCRAPQRLYPALFETYLFTSEFKVRTGHNALKWLRNFKQPKCRMAACLEILSEFDFVIEHRPGRLRGRIIARAMHQQDEEGDEESTQTTDNNGRNSPMLTTYNITRTADDNWVCRWINNELNLFQREDPVLNEVIKWVKSGARPDRKETAGAGQEKRNMWSQFELLKLVEGLLCREDELESASIKFLQLCLPRKVVPKILELLHALPILGHFGFFKICQRMKSPHYWKCWREDVEIYWQ